MDKGVTGLGTQNSLKLSQHCNLIYQVQSLWIKTKSKNNKCTFE